MPGPAPKSPDEPDIAPSNEPGARSLEDRVARVETALDFGTQYMAYSLVSEPGLSLGTVPGTYIGGVTVPFAMIRRIFQLPEARWDAWAAGWLYNTNSTTTLAMYYEADNTTAYNMGSISVGPAASYRKIAMGPYPVRGPFAAAKGAPQNENILSIGLMGNASAGNTSLTRWTLWIRQSPRRS